ncbi:MAG: polymerase subunit gamma/tau, partial [Variovorax sp.]|nr:polymerase subunit gamma/tau [Variovorax sp.]
PSRNGEERRPVAPSDTTQSQGNVVAVPMRVQPPPSQRDTPRNDDSVASPPIPSSEDGDFWHATVGQMVAAEAVTALTRELALQSQLVARDIDQWLLRVERESLNQASTRDKLQAALAALGHGVAISIEIGVVIDSPARRNKQVAEARQRAAEEAINSDPDVQALMRDFDAKIVPGTLRPA